MHYLTFDGQENEYYDLAILVPKMDREQILKYYVEPLGIDPSKVIAITFDPGKNKKTTSAEQKQYFNTLLPMLHHMHIGNIMCCEPDHFKTLTKLPKADANLGYVVEAKCDTAVKLGYTPNVVYAPNFGAVFYNPIKIKAKITQAVDALKNHLNNAYSSPGEGIIHFAAYPETYDSIKAWLQRLLDMDCDLTCDIEGFSLKHYDSGIGSIAFAWNKNEGIAFSCDYQALPEMNQNKEHGAFVIDENIHALLAEFFRVFKRRIIFHNISYDATVLIYQLYMKDILDTSGLLDGLDHLLKNWDDTKLISYLATNTCAGNELSLKSQAQEFAGNYAVEDIKDIRKIPKEMLLQYNLVDALSTWYVHEKRYPQMVNDQQEDIYENIFKPAVLDVIQMQLTGIPIDRAEVTNARGVLEHDCNSAINAMLSLPIIQRYIEIRNEQWVELKNSTYKKKRVTLADAKETFNPNSDKQLQEFLFQLHDLPVLDRTDTKLPSTGADTLKKLVNHTSDPEMIAFLKALIDFKSVVIILTTFIPAFERSIQGPDGWHYLFGNFNLGGTVSGRLSSNDPNLQNIPSTGSKYAKHIKKCVKAPPGWLFVGLDADSLEDKISALTTKDPNKLKVYTDGYDGHCLRAFFYFAPQMPNVLDNVLSINSIKDLYPELRQESKAPTFALTYQGTYHTLMNNCGFPQEKAMMIENKYKEAYHVSIKWVDDRLDIASKVGYVTVAFGLRVRTPLLQQVLRGSGKIPYEAQAEGRTAGNAMGQSWCMLTSRNASAFMSRVRKSQYRLCIKPSAQIHDAQYYMIQEDISLFLYVNENLASEARWQNHPDIAHPDVKLSGKTCIYYPSWAYELVIPNEVTRDELQVLIQKHETDLHKKGVLI